MHFAMLSSPRRCVMCWGEHVEGMNNTTAIIGAGIAGLVMARRLRDAGAAVVVLEKSRGVGGRMSTKRVGKQVFDQGAQFFTARSPEFVGMVDEWRAAGVAAEWPDGSGRMIGTPCMTAVPKLLADGVKVLREHTVTAVHRHDCGCWEIDVEGHGMVRAERLLMTAPVPQSLALLRAGEVRLPADVAAALGRITYHPCLALLATLAGPSLVPPEGVAFKTGPVRWLADNTVKGVSHGTGAVTIHASPEFSRIHYSASERDVAAKLVPVLSEWLAAPVLSAVLHRWRFAEPDKTHPERCVWLPELALGFAGDAFGGQRIEGAALSGLALVEKVRSALVV